jgi:hypothetical protein
MISKPNSVTSQHVHILDGKKPADGWYLNHSPEHYPCKQMDITKMAGKRIANTVEFSPHHCNIPVNSSANAALDATASFTHAL